MEHALRKVAGEHQELIAVGLKSSYDPTTPWDLVFRDAARDHEFWHREVEKTVVQFTTAQRSRPQLVDPGFRHLRVAGMPGGRQGSGASWAARDAPRRGARPGCLQRKHRMPRVRRGKPWQLGDGWHCRAAGTDESPLGMRRVSRVRCGTPRRAGGGWLRRVAGSGGRLQGTRGCAPGAAPAAVDAYGAREAARQGLR